MNNKYIKGVDPGPNSILKKEISWRIIWHQWDMQTCKNRVSS
jgi:hypothetical protein